MAITRANAEVILVRRTGAYLTAAGLDGTTVDGTNVDLNDPIAYAVRHLGYTVTDPTAVADADLANVDTDTETDELFDVAEFRALENIAGNLDDVDIRLGPQQQSLGQLAIRLQLRMARIEARLEKLYGFGLQSLETGVLQLGFQQENTTT